MPGPEKSRAIPPATISKAIPASQINSVPAHTNHRKSSWDEPIVHVPASRSRFKYWSNQAKVTRYHDRSLDWSNLTNTRTGDNRQGSCAKQKYYQKPGSYVNGSCKNQGHYPKYQKSCLEQVPSSELFERPVHTAIRSGIIPYTYHEGQLYWLMGITPRSKWSDFGGGCKTKMKETPANALIREVDEESSSVLTEIIQNIMENNPESIYVWRAKGRRDPPVYRYLSFVEIPYRNYNLNFVENREVSQLTWISQTILFNHHNLDRFHEPLAPYIRYFQHNLDALYLPSHEISVSVSNDTLASYDNRTNKEEIISYPDSCSDLTSCTTLESYKGLESYSRIESYKGDEPIIDILDTQIVVCI